MNRYTLYNQKNWNQDWEFSKSAGKDKSWEKVQIPHTWNGLDGQDGGNDYYRGTCCYRKLLSKKDVPENKEVYIEFEGTNSSAKLFVNQRGVMQHDGGYSTWRANISEFLTEEMNEILVEVDNAPNDRVYPQVADFTFYGGIYRNVNLLFVEKTRFDLDNFGGTGIRITPKVEGKSATVLLDAFLTNADGTELIQYQIYHDSELVSEKNVTAIDAKTEICIENVHLWNGRNDPYLYRLVAKLFKEEKCIDERTLRFGCRTFEIDPDRGFILNGKEYPLHGVSRHQDRPVIGNALLAEHHDEDMDLICEMGANTIRLAHYQHDQYFYDLCDEKGMIVWAEIPYISRHLINGQENTVSQMKELIVQNYHHPSIIVWGLSNEITMGGVVDEPLMQNHKVLNDLVHEMDETRLTTLAVVTMCSIDEPYVHLTDVVSYNHYYGWYGGDTSMNGEFMDEFHSKYPNRAIGMSEYGCEALNWHNSSPMQGDYTEEYQAIYHEELIKQLFVRPYIWSTHVWNMFDFAADARSEGGEDGMNHKGLVSFDRKYKKDAFYAYKAWLSNEDFVHICGKRYVDRVEDITKVTVYSNLLEVELLANGASLGIQKSEDHFFYFDVPNSGDTTLIAKAGKCQDESFIRKVETFNESYRMKEEGDVLNWFEITAPDGFFSINDKLAEIMANKNGARFIKVLVIKVLVKSKIKNRKQPKDKSRKMDLSPGSELMKLLKGMPLKRVLTMAGTMGPRIHFSKDEVLNINRKLNKIKK